MALDFKTPSELGDDYLALLKVLKPEVNTDQTDSDWYVRSRVVGGAVAGVYADQRLIANDAFPQSARHDALERHLNMYFGAGFNPAQPSDGEVTVTGTIGTDVPQGTQFLYEPNGNTYQSTQDVTLAATAQNIPVESVGTGQGQNLLSGAQLTISSPPAGLNNTAAASGNIGDGRDAETDEEAAARILSFIRSKPRGGTASDYMQWALEADPSVVSASVVRFPLGLGTVAVYISAGTANIDEALDNNQDIVLTPSVGLIAAVQDYIDGLAPLTDCPTVYAPNLVAIDVTMKVRFSSGNKDTIPTGQSLSQGDLVKREIKRALYETPTGGRIFDGSGFVVAAELEEMVDKNLGFGPVTVGNKVAIVTDRDISDLSASGANRGILPSEQPIPGTITIIELT